MNSDPKIAIISTVINNELYKKSSQLFPQNIDKYVIDGTNGMHGMDSICFMMKKLKGKEIDWLIMADEDVLFINPNSVYTLIDEMKSMDYIVCGVRDGGEIAIIHQNPYAINTFFSILNFKKLEHIWNEKEVLKHQYILENEFDDDLHNLKESYDSMSLFEPYYRFYFWLRRKKQKILFLTATINLENDHLTTLVFDINDEKMLYHTWYARSYGEHEMHTNRINKIFNLLKFKSDLTSDPIIFKHKTFYFVQKIKKIIKKIKMKINKISGFHLLEI